MALKIRRVVTGHDDNGRAVVAVDEICKNVMSRRPNHESCVVWSTGSFPPTIPGRKTAACARSRPPIRTAPCSGSASITPASRRAITAPDSIDYAIVLSGEIDMEIDGAIVHLRAGDVLVQRGTIHNWTNPGTEPCVVAFVLVAAKPVERAGKLLGAIG